MDGKPYLEALAVSKSYANVAALQDVTITVRPGEVVCLLGDNGAGKSTLIQVLSGVMPVYRNFFLGREPTIGWGPFKRFDSRRAIATAEEALRDLGVSAGAVRRPIGTLSGGQRQSVAVARAVHFGARILILDEPTSALGVKQSEMVLDYVRKAKERGIGVVLITHNVQHAYPIGDTFVVLFLGRQLGTFKKTDLSETQLMKLMAGKVDGIPGIPAVA